MYGKLLKGIKAVSASADKKTQRKGEIIQKEAAKQPQDEMKSINQKQLGKSKKEIQFNIAKGSNSDAVCA